MKVARTQLVDHLRSTYCGGLIPTVSFGGPFAAAAVAESQNLVVDTAGMEGAEELEEVIGVLKLQMLISALTAADVDTAEVHVREQRLVLLAGQTTLALVTADPGNVRTNISAKNLETVREAAQASGEGQVLDLDAVRAFLAMQSLLGGEEVTLVFTPSQSGLRVGKRTENQGQVELPGVVGEPGVKILPAAELRAVFGRVQGDARVWFSEHLVTVKTGRHVYYLSVLADQE